MWADLVRPLRQVDFSGVLLGDGLRSLGFENGLFLWCAILLRGLFHGVTIGRRAAGDTHSRTGRYGLSETVIGNEGVFLIRPSLP